MLLLFCVHSTFVVVVDYLKVTQKTDYVMYIYRSANNNVSKLHFSHFSRPNNRLDFNDKVAQHVVSEQSRLYIIKMYITRCFCVFRSIYIELRWYNALLVICFFFFYLILCCISWMLKFILLMSKKKIVELLGKIWKNGLFQMN